MSINLNEERQDSHVVVIQCGVGCLRHVVGITWFKWNEGDPDEPELYFETLHEPYEGFWMRLWRGWQFVVQRKPIGVDSTVVTVMEAQKIIDSCESYKVEWERWKDSALQQHTEP